MTLYFVLCTVFISYITIFNVNNEIIIKLLTKTANAVVFKHAKHLPVGLPIFAK